MRQFRRLFAAHLLILGLGLAGGLSAAETGAIDGHVQRLRDKRALEDVRVQVAPGGANTTTDADGMYSFPALAPGAYALTFTAADSEPVTRPATVAANTRTTVDVAFDQSVRAMATIVVEAQRTSAGLARAAQKEAENIVYVMPYEEIRKLPVVNTGDAVRMIPGVQLETDTGEGRFVNIRGLDSDLSSTTFGGVRLPPTDVTTSPFGGSRAVSFDAIPAAMIGALAVTKTNRPEQEAEALGGTVEITPRTVPRTGKPFFADLTLGSGYEPLRRTGIKDVALTIGGRFGANAAEERPLSFIGVFSYYEDRRGVDDLEEVYTDGQSSVPPIPDKAQLTWEERYYRQHKKRHVYGGEFAYAPDAANRWYLRYYDFGIVQDYNRNALLLGLSGNPTVQPDGTFVDTATPNKIYRSTTETFDTRLVSLGGNNNLEAFKLDYFIAHTQGSYRKPFDYIPVWTNAATSTVAYNNGDYNHPSFAVTGGANPYDVSGYTLSGFTNSTQQSITKDWSSKINVAIPTHLTSYATEELKFGVGARVRKYETSVGTYLATAVPAIPLSQAAFGPNITYYDARYRFGPLIGTGAINDAFANGSGFAHDPVVDAGNNARGSYSVREDVYAGYGQYQFGFGNLGIFAGLRIEATKSAFDAFAVTDTNQIQPISTDHKYTDYLPSLQTRYEFSPTLVGRAIYSSTIGRPGYNQESPSLNINLPANLVSQGNPDIKPTHAHNIDLSIEDYLRGGGILSFGVFYKSLQDYIVPAATTQTFPNSGLFAGFTGPVKVLTFKNGSAARLLGYEFDFEKRFVELPGLWSGFGAAFNWTGIDSRIEIRPGDFTQLPSTARQTGNATLFYERDHLISIRVGANYISRSVFAIGGSTATDIYSDSRVSLDLGSSYFVTDRISVYLNVKNLSNTPLKYSEGTQNRPIQRETYRQTIQVGLNASF
jgi:TonB-dependent receptor